MTSQNGIPEGCNWSAEEWAKWITERVNDRAQIFSTEPDEMVSAYNREITYTNDYHGRELLELLQNADDEGPGTIRSQKAIIFLCREGLCFANTGRPFSAAGIKSLMISDNSPKKYSRARHIGNRGLGFRSVLSWTDSPFILSGNLSIGFDKNRARDWLKELASKSARVKRKIDEVASYSSIIPVPTLAVPIVLDHQQIGGSSFPDASSFNKMLAVARELRSQGYDTVISLPFTSSTAFDEARAQLANTGREVIIFLRNIKELVIKQDSKESVWTASGSDSSVEISSTDSQETSQSWKIYACNGTIPDEFLKADQKDASEYEIRLAIPSKDIDTPGVLFSYFPTLIRFPFPLIAHISIELTNNRQYLVESRANAYLLKKLAQFMVETAESAGSVADPWGPLSLIAARSDLDLVAQKLGFQEALLEAAKPRDLIPVRDGRRLKAAGARRLSFGEPDWLPDFAFEDVTLTTDDPALEQMIKDLDTPQMSELELRDRLNRASPHLSMTARATLITELVKVGAMPKPPPNLLLDSKNELIAADTVTYVPPVEGATFDLPDWMTLRLLHSDLATALRSNFGGITSQELISRLTGFGLRPYSLASLTSAINARVNEIVSDQPDQEHAYRLSGLQTLFRLYSQTRENEIPKRPEDLRVLIPNRSGNYVHADTLYFGADYSGAELTEFLYGPLFPGKMVVRPDLLAIDAPQDKIKGFLAWLGVASKPRLHKFSKPLRDEEFRKHVLEQIPYPATFGDYIVHSAADLPDLKLTDVLWLDSLNEIIQSADPNVIVAWLALDERFERWRVNNDTQAKLSFRPYRAQYDRALEDQAVPSYVLWRLQRSAWLPTSDGGKRAPITCTLAPNLPEDVKAVLPRPALNESDERFKALRVDRKAIRFALERVGVSATLDDLSWEDFYTLLLRLPQLDPAGKYARALYRALVSRGGSDEAPPESVREKFIREGKLWARQKESTAYYPVSGGIYYADDATIPQVITREICMLELDRRRGAQKAHRLFGVKQLSYRDIGVEIKQVEDHPRAEGLQVEVERLKPYIYAMRLYSDPQAQGLRRLRALKVKLCRSAAGLVLIGDNIHEFYLGEGDMILSDHEGYLCSNVESAGLLLADPLIAHDVGEIFARLLGVENGGDFTSLAQCAPDLRLALLQRMLGVDPESVFDEALQKLKAEIDFDINSERFLPPTPATKPHISRSDVKTDPINPAPIADSIRRTDVIGKVNVKEVEHIPSPPSRQIKERVRVTPSLGRANVTLRQVTDAKRSQDLAYSFEEAEGQDRFPLRVDHLQGSEYFGCDLLSFATPEDLAEFEETLDENLILRFIEVKGRGAEKGTINLEGNELTSAFKHRDRFYLYRVFEAEDGKFEVAVLNDPTSSNPKVIYEIDLFRVSRTARYEVVIPAVK